MVVYSKVNKSDYSTLSLKGVTRMIAGREPQFTDLDQWICDLTHFNQLVKIGTFARFRMWKAFATWRKNVRSRYIFDESKVNRLFAKQSRSMWIILMCIECGVISEMPHIPVHNSVQCWLLNMDVMHMCSVAFGPLPV